MPLGPAAKDTAQQPHSTLILPTYNAAGFIDGTVRRLKQFVADHADWQILFVCDGCTDDTVARLRKSVADDCPAMSIEAYPVNRGKGYAVRRGLSLADTPYRIYTDVDLAYDPEEAIKVLAELEAGADLVVVNRANPDSIFLMSPRDFPTIYRRHVMSRVFNWWLRRMLPITLLDTQAGLKGLTADAWERLAPLLHTDGFFIDVELLARAGALGMKMGEIPITFHYKDPTTVKMVSHGWSMIKDTFRLRGRLKRDNALAPRPAIPAAISMAREAM